MKTLSIIIVAFFALSFQGNTQVSYNPEISISEVMTSSLTVEIKGLDSDKGTMKIGIYSSESQWLYTSQFKQSTKIVNGTATVVFENVPVGTYAISTYQDENDNSELDRGLFGIPSEPYASSRGAKGRFGPPKWKNAKFDITTESHTEVIKY